MKGAKSPLFVRVIDRLCEGSGQIAGVLTLVLMLIIVQEVFRRFVLNAPTSWSSQLSCWLLCYAGFFPGAYCLLYDAHVRVDILYRTFSTRTRAIVEIVTLFFLFAFAGVLTWKGGEIFWSAIKVSEVSFNPHAPWPMWPLYFALPASGALVFLQGVARFFRNIMTLITHEEQIKAVEGLAR